MLSSRFASLEGSIETFIEEQENQSTVKKTKRDVVLLTEFLQAKGGTRSETTEIPPAELNELFSEFILSVRTREGQYYDLRVIVASFEEKGILKESPIQSASSMT